MNLARRPDSLFYTELQQGRKKLLVLDDVYDRFGRLVGVNEETGCWEWQGAIGPGGYGRMRVDGKFMSAHRVAWMLQHDEQIPKGKNVCHTCDNRSCVNPAHLFIGSHQDNMGDRAQKTKKRKGRTRELNTFRKAEILEIRAASNRGLSFLEIAEKYKITPSDVHVIVEKDDWPWLQ